MNRITWFWILLLLCLGCSGERGSTQGSKAPAAKAQAQSAEVAMVDEVVPNKQGFGGRGKAGGGEELAQPAQPLPRKIVYQGDVRLIVEDFETAGQEVLKQTKAHKGYVAQSEVGGTSGAPRSGHWKVRVPVDQFQAFVEAVTHLGYLERNSTDSKDVSEEFYDTQTRIKVKQVQEERLVKLLEKGTGKLEDVLTVERELNRVREEIERLEGRVRLLANLSDLATVTVYLREEKNYVPPQPQPLTFGQRIGSTFADSFDLLSSFGRGTVLVLVALAPWLPMLVVVFVPSWWYFRRWASRANRTPAAATPIDTVS